MLKPTSENPPFLPCWGQFEPRTPEHFHTFEGSLYDTRDGFSKPLREQYKVHKTTISTPQDLLSTLRAGPYAFPGGYPLYLLTSDGAALSLQTVREELRNVLDSIRTQTNDGWRVVGCFMNEEDDDLFDGHTGGKLEPAYSDD